MKVFVAGATGALGRQLVPQLVARGHEVVGMTSSAAKQDLVRGLESGALGTLNADGQALATQVTAAGQTIHERVDRALG